MNPSERHQAIAALASALRPAAVKREAIAMTAGRIQAWAPSPTFGSKTNDEPPMLLPDALDVWVRHLVREYAGSLAAAHAHLVRASEIEDELLTVLTPEEAIALVEAEAGDDMQTCVNRNCGALSKRIIAGRCPPCYEYRRRHQGEDAPRSVIEERIKNAG